MSRVLCSLLSAAALNCSSETAPSEQGKAPKPHGGASAAFVCEPGASYGDPLEAAGPVVRIDPPLTGPATSFAYLEGPVWIGSLGKLFFSDIASSPQRIFSLTPPSVIPELFLDDSGSNGLAVDGEDRLVVADQPNHRITRVDPNTASLIEEIVPPGDFTPNDVVVRSDGSVYFTDPFGGLFHVRPSGALTGPITAVDAPNGVVLSPDEHTLYVGDVFDLGIYALPLANDGSVESPADRFATTVGSTLDGMAVDCAGNVYAATSSGVEVFAPSGEALGIVATGGSSNATFGGNDRKTLYVTSIESLSAVTLAVPGLPD